MPVVAQGGKERRREVVVAREREEREVPLERFEDLLVLGCVSVICEVAC